MSTERQQRGALRTVSLVLAGAIIMAGCGKGGGQAAGTAAPGGGTPVETAPAQTGPAIAVENAWARPAMETMPGMGATSAAYFTLRNNGKKDDALAGASTDVAGRTEIHETIPVEPGAANGMGGESKMGGKPVAPAMKMQPVEKVPLPAGGSVEFRPGGLHVMFMDVKKNLAEGDSFKLTLKFEKAEPQTIEVVVRKP